MDYLRNLAPEPRLRKLCKHSRALDFRDVIVEHPQELGAVLESKGRH